MPSEVAWCEATPYFPLDSEARTSTSRSGPAAASATGSGVHTDTARFAACVDISEVPDNAEAPETRLREITFRVGPVRSESSILPVHRDTNFTGTH